MAISSSRVGVPRTSSFAQRCIQRRNQRKTEISELQTLIISTSWSTPLSPGKMGCPKISSALVWAVWEASRFAATLPTLQLKSYHRCFKSSGLDWNTSHGPNVNHLSSTKKSMNLLKRWQCRIKILILSQLGLQQSHSPSHQRWVQVLGSSGNLRIPSHPYILM